MSAPDPAVYTPGEVAALLHISRGQVYELVRRGDLPALPFVGPRTIRVPRAALDRMIAETVHPAVASSSPNGASAVHRIGGEDGATGSTAAARGRAP